MAKCPKCDGTGISPNNKKARCSFCFGTGTTDRKVVPQTNEEWRKTCSTEEYATWLWKNFAPAEVLILWGKYGCPMYKDDNGVSRADYTEAMKKWLKEKHESEGNDVSVH